MGEEVRGVSEETAYQREQWCSERLDNQKELMEELYEEKLKILKESLTTFYQEQIQERDEKIEELETLLQEAKQQPAAQQSGGLSAHQARRRQPRPDRHPRPRRRGVIDCPVEASR